MALVNCPECQKEISNTLEKCPHCGYKLKTSSAIPTIMWASFVVNVIMLGIGTMRFLLFGFYYSHIYGGRLCAIMLFGPLVGAIMYVVGKRKLDDQGGSEDSRVKWMTIVAVVALICLTGCEILLHGMAMVGIVD